MTLRLEQSTDRLETTLAAALTIGTGDFSLGILLKRLNDPDTFAQVVVLSDSYAGSVRLGLEFDEDGTTLQARGAGGYGGLSGYATSQDVWYWADLTRGGTTWRLRVHNMSGTKVHDATITHATDYSTLDTILIGQTGNGPAALNGEVCNFKVQTGVAWSDGESWAEAQSWLIQKSGGTDRHAFRLAALNDSTAGLHSCTSTALLTNTGVVAGASRPSCLEYDPLASDDFNRANENPLAAPWQTLGGGFADSLTLTSNGVQGISQDAPNLYDDGTWQDDQWVEIVSNGTGNFDHGPMLRCATGAGYVWFNAGTAGIRCATAGDFAMSDIATRGPTLAAQGVYRFQVVGTTFGCYYNGVLVGTTFTDGTRSTGKPGIFSYDSSGVIDSFAGGRFGTPPEDSPTIRGNPAWAFGPVPAFGNGPVSYIFFPA